MNLTRRTFLAASAAALPTRLWSGVEADFGGRRVLSLSDGHLELPPDFILAGLSPDQIAALRLAHGLPEGPLIAPCNVTLLRDGDNTVLFDVGAGHDFQSTAGRLTEALEAAGLTPPDITHVVFTHGHPDHLWGLLDEFDEPFFPQAQHFIGGVEFDYWTDPETVNTIDASRTTFAVGAKRRLDTLADMFERIGDGDTPLPGVTARATTGHTPGHLSFDLGDIFVTGDCIGNAHIAFDQPEFPTASDQNPPEAAETRARLMANLAASGQPILGFHLTDGGIGRIVTADAGYRFEAS